MIARCMMDANVLVDFLCRRAPFWQVTRKMLVLGYVRELELWVSSSQLPALAKAASAEQLRSLRCFLRVCAVGESEVDAALDSTWGNLDDALVYQAARSVRADFILTRNQRGFAQSSIRALSPDELFAWLLDEKGLAYEEVPW